MKSKNPSGRKVVKIKAFIVLNEKNTLEVCMIADRLGNNGLAIYPFEARALDEDGEPFRGTTVVPCEITYKSK